MDPSVSQSRTGQLAKGFLRMKVDTSLGNINIDHKSHDGTLNDGKTVIYNQSSLAETEVVAL